MLQADKPEDFVVATGETYTVRQFCEYAFDVAEIPITWEGEGVDEVALDKDGNKVIQIDPQYFRPAEVELLLGDPTKAKKLLGWEPTVDCQELAKLMVESDLEETSKIKRIDSVSS